MNKITFKLISVVLLSLLIFSCKNNAQDSADDTPTNLKITTQITGQTDTTQYGDGSGKVTFNISASNATSYLIQTDGQSLVIDTKEGGSLDYTYKSYKGKHTYSVYVAAYNGNIYKDTTFQVTVNYEIKYKLEWSDEFDGTALNMNNWSVETGTHVNNELQVYTETGNYDIKDGVLTITCKKVDDNAVYGSYTSARINTYGKQSFKYGRIEARLKLPKGKGTWPAFWMLGNNIGTGTSWPTCGEIDIMEYVGVDPYWVQSSLHCQTDYGSTTRNGRYQLASNNDEGEWHVYGMIWTEDYLSFYVDDYEKPFYTCQAPTDRSEATWPYDNQFFIILNFAFGGNWGGYDGVDTSLDNMTYQVDWVRYYVQQ